MLNLVDMLLENRVCVVEQLRLLCRQKHRQRVRVALLERSQQQRTVLSNGVDCLDGMFVERGEAITGQRRGGIAEHAADIHARGLSADEQPRIDGRVEQRKLASDASNVLTMPQLEQ